MPPTIDPRSSVISETGGFVASVLDARTVRHTTMRIMEHQGDGMNVVNMSSCTTRMPDWKTIHCFD